MKCTEGNNEEMFTTKNCYVNGTLNDILRLSSCMKPCGLKTLNNVVVDFETGSIQRKGVKIFFKTIIEKISLKWKIGYFNIREKFKF